MNFISRLFRKKATPQDRKTVAPADGLQISHDGTKRWLQNGTLHRDDGPAVETADGSKEWWRNGALVATEEPDGTKSWWRNGQLHREDGPAVEYPEGLKFWFRDGKKHRDDGPAVEDANGVKEWWLNGKQLTQEDAERLRAEQQRSRADAAPDLRPPQPKP